MSGPVGRVDYRHEQDLKFIGLMARGMVRAGVSLAFPDLVLPGFPGDDLRDPVHPLHFHTHQEKRALGWRPTPPYRPRHAKPEEKTL